MKKIWSDLLTKNSQWFGLISILQKVYHKNKLMGKRPFNHNYKQLEKYGTQSSADANNNYQIDYLKY